MGTALAVPAFLPQPVAAQGRATPTAGFADLAERLLPAVVNISTTQVIKAERGQPQPGQPGQPGQNPQGRRGPEIPQFPPGSPFEEFFKEFFDRQGRNGPDATP